MAGEMDEEMLLVRFLQFSEGSFNSSLASCSTESAEMVFSWGTFPLKRQIDVYYPIACVPCPEYDIMALLCTLVVSGGIEGVLFLNTNSLFVYCYCHNLLFASFNLH